MSYGFRCWFTFSILVCTGVALAQAPPPETEVETITTERPTQGYSPELIPAGSLQVETGFGATVQRRNYALDLPQAFVLLGLAKRFEVRFLTSDEVWRPSSSSYGKSIQSTDTQFSGKFLISGANSWLPKSAVLSLDFPTGGTSFTSGSYDPGATLIWTQSLPHGIFINELAQATLSTWNGALRAIWTPSIAGGIPITKIVTAFAEYAPNILQDGSLTYVVDGGVAFTRGKLRQIDLRGGILKDDRGRHLSVTVGYSVRYDSLIGASRAAHRANGSD